MAHTDKKIEDYLHLYLGCEVQENEGEKGVLEGIRSHSYYVLFGSGEYNSEIRPLDANEFKLILRKLGDMDDKEAKYIFKYYFQKDYTEDWTGDTGSAYFNPKRITPTKYHALRIINGEDYSTGDFLKVIELVRYLLSKHFDLFGLIEAGLAIDKTSKVNRELK